MMPARPKEIYTLWLDSKQHGALTGGEAQISSKVSGSFTVFDGWATGKNVELVPYKKIVQTWHASDWPETAISTITLTLLPAKGGTKLLFQQAGVPKRFAKSIAQGWQDYYWKPMKAMFTERKAA